MPPARTEVKPKLELLAGGDGIGNLDRALILPHDLGRELIVRKADQPSVAKTKLVQMREVPARKPGIDRVGQRAERVPRPHQEHATRMVALIAADPHQHDLNLKPRPRHRRRRLPRGSETASKARSRGGAARGPAAGAATGGGAPAVRA